MKTLKFYEDYLNKLEGFGQEDWVKDYIKLQEKPNFWTILEYGESDKPGHKSAYEIRSSRMIRWLLDANENHNLGNVFAYKLAKLVKDKEEINNKKDYIYDPGKNNKIEAVSEEHADIDVFYKDISQKIFIAIEVKQYAKEGIYEDGKSQLDKYEKAVEKLIKEYNQEIHSYYIFLTPLGDSPTNKNWTAISYKEFIELIDQVILNHISKSKDIYKEDIKKILLDFRDDLQRTLNILEKDTSYIEENFSDKDKKFTIELANEIWHGMDTGHMEEIRKLDKANNQDLKKLILLIRESISVQDHTPNPAAGILARKIYNYLSAGKELDYNTDIRYKEKERTSEIKESLINKYDLGLTRVRLTEGKGQGLNIYHKSGKHRIYLSADTHGNFPNDGIKIASTPGSKVFFTSKEIRNGEFQLEDELILTGKIRHKDFQLEDELILTGKIRHKDRGGDKL